MVSDQVPRLYLQLNRKYISKIFSDWFSDDFTQSYQLHVLYSNEID
jgi:hypothetical protein